jgi:hypothetical protein
LKKRAQKSWPVASWAPAGLNHEQSADPQQHCAPQTDTDHCACWHARKAGALLMLLLVRLLLSLLLLT